MADSPVALLDPADSAGAPDPAVESAAVGAAEAMAPEESGPVCPNCGAPSDGEAWCRFCGYVARLGTCIDVDGEAAAAADEEQMLSPTAMLGMVPTWAWLLGGCILATIALSASSRLVTAPYTVERLVWYLVQMLLGLTVFLVAHFRSYLNAITDNAQLAVPDIVIKPLSIWLPTFRALPQTLRRTACGACGLVAAVGAPLLVGGVDYERVWEFGPRAKPKQNLLQAITAEAAKAQGGAKSLEEAVNDFAKGNGDGQGMDVKPKEVIERPRSVECVIVGYTPVGEHDFGELLLATVVDQKLKVVGAVSEGIELAERSELVHRLKKIERPTPFLSTTIGGFLWVEPRLACKVKYRRWTDSNRLESPLFDEMLSEVSP